MRGKGAGTPALHGNKGPGAAMERALRQLPTMSREEDSPLTSQGGWIASQGGGIENSEAGATKAPARVRWDTAQFEPSPQRHLRPVLVLVEGTDSTRQRSRTNRRLCLKLVCSDGVRL